MELLNGTRMQAGYTAATDPDGRERVVVAVKGTFTIPHRGREPELTEEQAPLVMADEFTGKPGLSATLYEADFAACKPRCDVLLNGSAHAPRGRPAAAVDVGMRVGAMTKAFRVVGDRAWEDGVAVIGYSAPIPFQQMPISYDRAYGGTEVVPGDPENGRAYGPNPAGVGFYPFSRAGGLIGRPLPNTEEFGDPATSPAGRYRPMSFGAVGRNFAARVPLAGTYDQHWLDNVFPFLPADFDPRYHQAAPPDQQIDHPTGGEEVELVNLTPDGHAYFRLPSIRIWMRFTDRLRHQTERWAVLDTITLEPDDRRCILVWRGSIPLKRNLLELRQCLVGLGHGGEVAGLT